MWTVSEEQGKGARVPSDMWSSVDSDVPPNLEGVGLGLAAGCIRALGRRHDRACADTPL